MNSYEKLHHFVRQFKDQSRSDSAAPQPARSPSSKQLEKWNELLGSHCHEFLADRGKTDAALAHPDDNVRLGAYQMIARYWGPVKESWEFYLNTVVKDRNNRIRSQAVACLGKLFAETFNPKVSDVLRLVVLDKNNSAMLRGDAYFALLEIHGQQSRFEWTYMPVSTKDDLDAHIDSAFLDSIAAHGGTG